MQEMHLSVNRRLHRALDQQFEPSCFSARCFFCRVRGRFAVAWQLTNRYGKTQRGAPMFEREDMCALESHQCALCTPL